MRELQRILNDMFGQVQRNFNAAEAIDAKRDPKAHKLSRVMEGKYGLRYVYTDGGKDGRGRKVWFCRSTHRNVAGYFLVWRQVEKKAKKKAVKPGDLVSTIERDQWAARRSKKSAIEVCRRRAAAFRKRQAARSARDSEDLGIGSRGFVPRLLLRLGPPERHRQRSLRAVQVN